MTSRQCVCCTTESETHLPYNSMGSHSLTSTTIPFCQPQRKDHTTDLSPRQLWEGTDLHSRLPWPRPQPCQSYPGDAGWRGGWSGSTVWWSRSTPLVQSTTPGRCTAHVTVTICHHVKTYYHTKDIFHDSAVLLTAYCNWLHDPFLFHWKQEHHTGHTVQCHQEKKKDVSYLLSHNQS